MKSESRKYIPIEEFRKEGYLQEVNRRFLHPLGLALEVDRDDNGNEYLSGIWDSRDDPEGIIYDLENSDEERIEKFSENRNNVNKQFNKTRELRMKLCNQLPNDFGRVVVEDIPAIPDDASDEVSDSLKEIEDFNPDEDNA